MLNGKGLIHPWSVGIWITPYCISWRIFMECIYIGERLLSESSKRRFLSFGSLLCYDGRCNFLFARVLPFQPCNLWFYFYLLKL